VRLQQAAAVCVACAMLTGSHAAFAQPAAVAIVSPQNEETVHDNNGNVAVQVAVNAETGRGDQLVLLLDGNPIVSRGGSDFMLAGVPRGTHTLQAQLVDSSRRPRALSPVVTFYMWQASLLAPNRRRPQ